MQRLKTGIVPFLLGTLTLAAVLAALRTAGLLAIAPEILLASRWLAIAGSSPTA